MSLELTLQQKLDIRFIDARHLTTQAKLRLGLAGYPTQEQKEEILQIATEVFNEKPDREKLAMRVLKESLDTYKIATSAAMHKSLTNVEKDNEEDNSPSQSRIRKVISLGSMKRRSSKTKLMAAASQASLLSNYDDESIGSNGIHQNDIWKKQPRLKKRLSLTKLGAVTGIALPSPKSSSKSKTAALHLEAKSSLQKSNFSEKTSKLLRSTSLLHSLSTDINTNLSSEHARSSRGMQRGKSSGFLKQKRRSSDTRLMAVVEDRSDDFKVGSRSGEFQNATWGDTNVAPKRLSFSSIASCKTVSSDASHASLLSDYSISKVSNSVRNVSGLGNIVRRRPVE